MDTNLLNRYCTTNDIQYFNRLSPTTKEEVITLMFEALRYYKEPFLLTPLEKLGLKMLEITPSFIISTFYNDTLFPTESLERNGVVCIPVVLNMKEVQAKFLETLQNFQEYKPGAKVRVIGGFAAFGNPSSFHNPLVRELRMEATQKVIPLFKEYTSRKLEEGTWHLQCLFDRMMYRLKGQAPQPESWHRDVMNPTLIHPDDEVFGGWINLDSNDQHFSCIPGSHLNVIPHKITSGFATLGKEFEDKKLFSEERKQKLALIKTHKHSFTIKPGEIIIFPQYILHEVLANKATENMMRLFVGWRLTKVPNPKAFYKDFDTLLTNQAVMALPGGYKTPMYANNYIRYYQHKPFTIAPGIKQSLVEWSASTFQDRVLETKSYKGKEYKIVPQTMKSLKEYGFELYPPYTEEERRIYEGVKL